MSNKKASKLSELDYSVNYASFFVMSEIVTKNTYFKILYLLTLTIVLFISSSFEVIAAALLLQLVILLRSKVKIQSLFTPLKRLSILFTVIIISYSFFPPQEGMGVVFGIMMCVKIAILVLASFWLQSTEKPSNLVSALKKLYLPEMAALSISTSLALLSGSGKGNGKGGGKNKGKKKIKISFAEIREQKLDWVHTKITESFAKAAEYIEELNPTITEKQKHDLSIIVGIVLAIMSLKILQLLPGLPIAPGHKNLLIIPMLLLASSLTNNRWGGFITGTTAGVVSVMLGYGKYGFLEVAHFAAPGLLADLLLPLSITKKGKLLSLISLASIGAVIGAGRFAANFLVITLAGAPLSAFAIYTPMLFSQIIFGALSSLVAMAIVNNKSYLGEVKIK